MNNGELVYLIDEQAETVYLVPHGTPPDWRTGDRYYRYFSLTFEQLDACGKMSREQMIGSICEPTRADIWLIARDELLERGLI